VSFFDFLSRKSADTISIDTLISRLELMYQTGSGVSVTPDNCMESPTVQAVVTGVARRLSTLPVQVLKKEIDEKGRTSKVKQPNHPVQKLLSAPNSWQSGTSYWLDATSSLIRHGNFYAYKQRGVTGPIRGLLPLNPGATEPKQRDDWSVYYEAVLAGGSRKEFDPGEIHHVRLASRGFLKGDSPIVDVRETIALEIAAEKFGAAFFGNGAMPSLLFQYAASSQGHKTDEERANFIREFQEKFTSKKGRFTAGLLPKGIELGNPIEVANDKAQFLETRKLQRSIIAGALGVPPHLVGDLERATFSNVENQSLDFIQSVILPYARCFEAAMERDLLTTADRNAGIIIRFNLDGALRGDFKSRQEGQAIMRQNGIINADEWRENENMNPRTDDGGEGYYAQGPSGQQTSPQGDTKP
jgi:HK97 family phage portal protein